MSEETVTTEPAIGSYKGRGFQVEGIVRAKALKK